MARGHTTSGQGTSRGLRSIVASLGLAPRPPAGEPAAAPEHVGLLDHAGLTRACTEVIAHVGEGTRPAILVVGLHGVGGAQDAGGLSAGEELQEVITRRLLDVGEGYRIARLSDHEFGVLFDHLPQPGPALDLAERIMSTLAKPVFLTSQRRVELSACCGLATWGVAVDAATAEGLLRAADLAMREAWRSGRSRTEVCTGALIATADERLAIGQDLRQALADRGLGVCYQPLVDIRDGALLGFEALVRWSHPVHGQVPPDRFVPLAEEFGLITELGRIVLSTATAQVQQWSAASGLPLSVHVNVSGSDLAADGFVAMVEESLLASGLSPSRLVLELTEAAVIPDLEVAGTKCLSLHELGVRVAMDDFGTGRAAQSHLQSLGVDILKIDRSYFEEADSRKVDELLAGVISLAHALDMEVFGEGIEDEGQRERLEQHGCVVGQGYLFSEPLTSGDAAAYLRRHVMVLAPDSAAEAAEV
jgi:diguanylate cyclase